MLGSQCFVVKLIVRNFLRVSGRSVYVCVYIYAPRMIPKLNYVLIGLTDTGLTAFTILPACEYMN